MTSENFLQQLLTLPTVSQAVLSPDGRWVAFEWYRRHENLDVFLVPADGSRQPVDLTHTPEATGLVRWAPDSNSVIVAEDHDNDEHVRLFQVRANQPGRMVPLTEDRPAYFIRGGSLSRDGRTLFYGANFDFDRQRVIGPTWIYRHDLESGVRTVLARPERPAYTTPELNLAGTHLIYARKDRHPSGRQFYLVDVDGSQDEEILNFGDQVKVYARWLPDSENILVIAEGTERGPQDYISLGVYHWPSRKLRWLIDDPQRTIEGAWVSPDGLVVVDEIREAGHHPSYLDPATGKEIHFPPGRGNLRLYGRAADGAWVGLRYDATSPEDLVRIPGPGKEQVSLTGVWHHTQLDPSRLTAAEAVAWESGDGLRIRGWLYRAADNPRRAVIYIHGGPSYHSEDKLNPEIQYLVSQGFNLLDVNYRGSTGFGLPYREAIKTDGWGGREQADLAAGAEWLIDQGLAEPGRVGVTGTSYGGYSAWFLITHYPPELIGAAAPICGMTDLVVDYETTRPDLRPLSEEMLGGSPLQAPERYAERSPIHFVHHIRGKLLIVQGAQDPNVTPENVRQVRRRLDASRIPYELLVFEDEGHGIYRPANQAVLYERLATFFGQALG